jgi:hypothetical protein
MKIAFGEFKKIREKTVVAYFKEYLIISLGKTEEESEIL